MILDMESWMNIRRFRALHAAGATFVEIGRECGCDWRTCVSICRGRVRRSFGRTSSGRLAGQCPVRWCAFEEDSRCLVAAVDGGDGFSMAGRVELCHGSFGEVAAVADLPLVVHVVEDGADE